MAALQPVDDISRAEAIAEIGRRVNEQTAAFRAQAQQTTGLNDQTRAILAEFRNEVAAAGTALRTEVSGYKAIAED